MDNAAWGEQVRENLHSHSGYVYPGYEGGRKSSHHIPVPVQPRQTVGIHGNPAEGPAGLFSGRSGEVEP